VIEEIKNNIMIVTEPGYYYVHHHEGREHCLIRVKYFTETQVNVFFIDYTGWWFVHETRNFLSMNSMINS